jgi:hypothetical protein
MFHGLKYNKTPPNGGGGGDGFGHTPLFQGKLVQWAWYK